MFFTIKKEQVIDSLQKAASIIPSKAGATYLRSLWLVAKNNNLTVMSTDANIEFISSHPAVVNKEGILGVNGRQFFDLVSRMSDNEITLSYDEDQKVDGDQKYALVSGKKSKYKLPIFEKNWFNELNAFPEGESAIWSGDSFGEMIERVYFCIDDNEASDALACLFMNKAEDGVIDICGLNGHQFALIRCHHESLEEMLPKEGILLQKKYVQEIKKWLSLTDIEIQFTEKRFFIRTTDKKEMLSVPRTYFTYPDYSAFLQRLNVDDKSLMQAQKQDFIEALERISTVSAMNTQFDFTSEELTLSAQGSETGSADERLHVEYKGHLTQMLFHTKKFLEVLKHFNSKSVQITFTGEEGPCGLNGEEDSGYTVIIMPMKINKDSYY